MSNVADHFYLAYDKYNLDETKSLPCGACNLQWLSVTYHIRVTVTLTSTSGLVFRKIVSVAYLSYY